MSDEIKRIPKNYDGKYPTGRQIKRLLPKLLGNIDPQGPKEKQLVIDAWDKIMGKKLSTMSSIEDFKEKVVYVSVKNSSLYSILKTQQKPMLLRKLKEALPCVEIQNIVFRIGM